MTDERNDAARRDGADEAQNPPPLIPPPVRRNDTGEQVPVVSRRQEPVGSDEPVFREPTTDGNQDRQNDSDANRRNLSGEDGQNGLDEREQSGVEAFDSAGPDDSTDGPVGRDLIEERHADPAYDEPRLDPAPQSVAASPIPTVDPPTLVGAADDDADDDGAFDGAGQLYQPVSARSGSDDRAFASTPTRSGDAQRDDAVGRNAGTSAQDVADNRQAVRDTAADAQPVVVANPSTTPDATPSPVFVPPAQGGYEQTAAYPPAPVAQREFVEPPVEPKMRGNRGIGSLIAVLSVILFAIIYSAIAAAIIVTQQPQDLGEIFIDFVQSPAFYIPAIIFVVAFIIVVLLANRASWWAYVLGSLLVGALVYFGSIGVALLLANPATLTPSDARALIEQRALNPFLITAALVAREVSLWTGSAIASRGRRMKSRNLTAREEYERASEEHRAEYERSRTA